MKKNIEVQQDIHNITFPYLTKNSEKYLKNLLYKILYILHTLIHVIEQLQKVLELLVYFDPQISKFGKLIN